MADRLRGSSVPAVPRTRSPPSNIKPAFQDNRISKTGDVAGPDKESFFYEASFRNKIDTKQSALHRALDEVELARQKAVFLVNAKVAAATQVLTIIL